MLFARLMTLLANLWRSRDEAAAEVKDFLPEFWAEGTTQGERVADMSEQEQVAFLEMLTASFGGRDLRQRTGSKEQEARSRE